MDLQALAKECGLDFYDSEIVNENNKTIYRIYITKNGGVTLDDCEKFSRLLSPILDVTPPVNGDYTLEVSSPGLERNLKKEEHFISSIGEKIIVTLNSKEKFEGEILSFEDEILTIKTQSENLKIKFSDIKKARTFIEW
ncbi:ribosome maturation factor RimP [Campylobacter corcagiensis]|uniref:ribosome maturation factor RimP n=1 Tax=Campylobacter corcagiensis TaxID=1448857 RepID=UPI000470D276|nr:ribosome maturation factor RimP [Campylobacter corcagiensis]